MEGRNLAQSSRLPIFLYFMKLALYSVITREISGFLPTLIRITLTPFSWVYRILVTAHQWLYDHGLLRQNRLPCPVISVGNIVAGGTGKTPATIWIAKTLQQAGIRSAILLRGYGRQSGPSVAFVSGGTDSIIPVTASGDEAAMTAIELPGVPVLVGKDRYTAGLQAIRSCDVQAIILDDGFQHRKLARDLEILTVDATQPFGTGKLLPAGTLRQPTSALSRADVILLTRTDLIESSHQARESVESVAPGISIVESCHHPIQLYQLGSDEKFELQCLKDKRLLAVCGIGNPNAFAETLRQYEPQHLELLAFPDHYQYLPADLERIQNRANEIHATLIVTTRKDEQRLQPLLAYKSAASARFEELRFYVLGIELVITEGQELLSQRIWECVKEV